MKRTPLKSTVMLILTAAIWGFAFVAQSVAADTLGAFTFNGIRFYLRCCFIAAHNIYI